MRETTESFLEFRTSCIQLWENCFLKIIDPDRLSRQCLHYNLIIKRLFHVVILEPNDIYIAVDSLFSGLPPLFAVSSNHVTKENIFVSRDGKGGPYWDCELGPYVLTGLEVVFVEFFDFDEISDRNFRYVKVKIVKFPADHRLVGYLAIIPFEGAQFKIINKLMLDCNESGV